MFLTQLEISTNMMQLRGTAHKLIKHSVEGLKTLF
jgi:hypothetical protein